MCDFKSRLDWGATMVRYLTQPEWPRGGPAVAAMACRGRGEGRRHGCGAGVGGAPARGSGQVFEQFAFTGTGGVGGAGSLAKRL